MPAKRDIIRAGPLLVPALLLTMAASAVAQEAPEAAGDGLDDALVVALQGVLDRMHQQGSLPAEPRLVVTPDVPYAPEAGPATGGPGAGMGIADLLAERFGASVAELEEVQECPTEMPGACTLQGVDAVVSVAALQGTAERADVDVLVTYAVPRIVHEPVRSVAYRVGLSRLGPEWTVTSMRLVTTM